MTNTINNVPRELLERAWRALANSATGREIGAYLDADPCAPECAETCARASMCSTCSAILSAPSPAGVDGLEVATFLHTLHMELGQTEQFCSKWKGDPFGVSGVDYSSTYSVTSEPLCRLSDAQAIIDGLLGEVARSKQFAAGHVLTNERISESLHAVEAERDQQAQRIGELEKELVRITGLWELELGRAQKAEASLFSAAISAGKELE